MKKRFCALLAALLLVCVCPIAALADASGTYEGLTYTYDSASKTLTLSGTAQMKSLTNFKAEMTNRGITDVQTLKIEEGVKAGYLSHAMNGCRYPNVIMPKSLVESADTNSFYSCGFQNVTIAASQIPSHVFTYANFDRLELLPGLKSIGRNAFFWTDFRDSLILPEGLEKVDEAGFIVGIDIIFACRIPDSLTDIGKDAFSAYFDGSAAVLYVESAVIPENAYTADKTYIAHLNGGDIKDRAAKMNSLNFETPVKPGYRFAGWYDNPAFEGARLGQAFERVRHDDPAGYGYYETVEKWYPDAVHIYAKWVTEEAPATGDSASPLLWAGLALSALLVMASLLAYKKHSC